MAPTPARPAHPADTAGPPVLPPPAPSPRTTLPTPLVRGLIEVGFIIFLFYSNLLMGEFTRANAPHTTLAAALRDIFTLANFTIAIVSAVIAYLVFEQLRKKL